MINRTIQVIILSLLTLSIRAQKKLITNESYKSWEVTGGYNSSNLSGDGKYLVYAVGSREGGRQILTSTDANYTMDIKGTDATFTEDSRKLLYMTGDTLVLFDLAKKSKEYLLHANSFKIAGVGKELFIAYRSGKNLILKNMSTHIESTYSDVKDFKFTPNGNALLIFTKTSLSWIDLKDNKLTEITKVPPSVYEIRFDNSGTQLAYMVNDKMTSTLRYFKVGMDSSVIKFSNQSPGLAEGLSIMKEAPSFSADGKLIFFKIFENLKDVAADPDVITNKVDVWNYQDVYLQSEQLWEKAYYKDKSPVYRGRNVEFTVSLSSTGDKFLILGDHDTKLASRPGNKYVLVNKFINEGEAYWNKSQVAALTLVSLSDGHRTKINATRAALSPDEKFVYWVNTESNDLFGYEIVTGTTRNITEHIKIPLFQCIVEDWLANDAGVILQDGFDIWQVDPLGNKAPIYLTAGFGRKHNISFRVIKDEKRQQKMSGSETLVLTALDKYTKNNGFWKTKLGEAAEPVKGNMEACLYYYPGMYVGDPPPPIKAKNAEVYIMMRQTASQASNIVATKDFRVFTQLSHAQPQKDYNWMTSELHHWTMTDGKTGTGVLYKPENFDPNKKYPLIFHYYQERGNELHQFLNPELSPGALNIAWYVSNGYLVFLPDIINDNPGYIGKTVLNSVVSAAKYLSTFSWVDATKMGIQGHSFGGFETNLLVAKTTIFAAAQSSAGPSDLVSMNGSTNFGDKSASTFIEKGQVNMQVNMWGRPDLYMESSPIFTLDKVTTPLLIQHGKLDGGDGGGVPFAQSVELFTSLRRLQKPVWMLQYDGVGHIINDDECILDFNIRQQQFFDHYLKGKPAPKWMTQGIPAREKGIKSGLEF